MTRNELMKLNGPRKSTITNSFGVYDLYKIIRKNKWYNIGQSISESLFYSIVRNVNKCLAQKLVLEGEIVLPHRMGILEIRKIDNTPRLVNGKLKIRYPVDWKKTIDLWLTDTLAKLNKILIRKQHEKVGYFIYYNKHGAIFRNKSFYKFKPHRSINILIKQLIDKGIMDAYSAPY